MNKTNDEVSEPQASKCDTCPIDVEVRRNTRCPKRQKKC